MPTNSVIVMFHTTHASVNRSGRSGLHTFFGTIHHRKATLRRAIILCVVAGIFLLTGSILTWLAFRDIFGNRVSGPVLLALAFIILLLSIHRFVQAKKHIAESRSDSQQFNSQTVGVVVEEGNSEGGTITVIMDGIQLRNAWREEDIDDVEDNVSPPSYTEATDTSCLEPPVVVLDVSPDDDEAPPTYEEAIVDTVDTV